MAVSLAACGEVASVEEEGSLAGAVTPLAVTKQKIENIKVGIPYSQTITIEGGQPPYLYQVTHGSLPTGLALNEKSGELSGTVPPSEAGGKASFTIKVTDNLGLTAEQQYAADIEVYEFNVFPEAMPTVAPGFAFELGFSAPGSLPPVNWTYSGKLPPGLELDNAKGILKSSDEGLSTDYQGTEWEFTVIATDVSKIQSSRTYKLQIAKTIPIPAVKIATTGLPDATAGAPYAASVAVTGGVSPFKFELLNGTLVAGLTLDAKTGLISGNVPRPEIGKKASFAVKVTDMREQSHEYPFSITVLPYTFTLAPEELPTVTPSQAYSFKVSAVGAAEPVVFSVSGALPPGLVLDANTGRITDTNGGVPTGLQNTVQTFTIVAEDANKVRVSRQYDMPIGPASVIPTLQIVTPNLGTNPASGTSFTRIVAVSGGVTPYTFSSPDLPAWLSINAATGELSGTVPYFSTTQAQVFNVFVLDANASQVSKTYALTINPYTLSVSPAGPALPAADPGASYQTTLIPSGREPAFSSYTFNLQSGTLPAGLTLSSSGVISGTVTESEEGQTRNFVVNVTDAVVNKPTSYSITVNNFPLAVSSVLASATEGAVYSGSITASYSSPVTACGTCTFEITGSLPAGLTVAANGAISGTPAAGSGDLAGRIYNFSVRARDALGKISRTTAASITVNVSAPTLTVDASAPQGRLGQAYSWRGIAAAGGRPPFVYALTAGTLPAGLALNASTGEISGTPTAPVACPGNDITLRATDALGQLTSTHTRCVEILATTVSTAALTDAYENSAYTFSLSATGGTSPYSWEFFPNPQNLPNGLTFSSSGVISGTPAAFSGSVAGISYTFDVRTTDATGLKSPKKTLVLTVRVSTPSVVVGTVPSGLVGSSYTYTVGASGGRPPYSYSLGGSLPAGLSLTSGTGVISGLPSATSTCPASGFTIVAVDSLAQSSTSTPVCITINSGISFNENTVPTVVRSTFYSTTLSVTGGTGPYVYSAVNLPTGLSMNSSTGEISGFTTVASGTYTGYVSAQDANSKEATRTYNFVVANGLAFDALVFPAGGVGLTYAPVALSATGGVPPYTFTVNSGNLPSGLALAGGTVSGTPDGNSVAAGPYTFTFRVNDSSGLTAVSAPVNVNVYIPPMITTKTLRPARTNDYYGLTVMRVSGVAPFTWSATGLPTGLSIDANTGTIGGIATSAGTYGSVQVTVTDANGLTNSKTYSMQVRNSGKVLDLHAAAFSEPCDQSASYNCAPRAYKVGKMVAAQPTTNYLVYGGTLSGGSDRIYVARIDSRGRIPTPGTSNLSVALTPGGWIASIDLNDIDNDGHRDIIAANYETGKVQVFWNNGTVDANGMPEFTAPTNFNLPGTLVRPYTLRVTNLDPSKPLRKDIVATTNWSYGTNQPVNGFPDPDTNSTANYMNVVVFTSQCEVASCASRSTVYTAGGTVALLPANLPSTGRLLYASNINVGQFRSTDACRDIVVTGRSTASGNRSYVVVFPQNTSGATCQGTFNTTTIYNEVSTASNDFPAGIAVADFNADGIDDIATVLGNKSWVEVYMMNSNGTFPASPVRPTLSMPGTEIVPYCLDGAASCTYPSLAVIGNKPPSFLGAGTSIGNWHQIGINGINYVQGYIAFLPNQGSGTFFEDNTNLTMIEYSIPPGVMQPPVVMPIVSSTRNDILIAGSDNLGMPYVLTFTNNNGNAADPLKQAVMAKSMPDEFQTTAEVGSIEAVDINNDGSNDMVSHLLTNSALSTVLGPMNVALSAPSPLFTTAIQHFGGSTSYYRQHTIGSGDFDNDGYQDIVTAGYTGRGIGVSFGSSTGELSAPNIYAAGAGDIRPNHLKVADIDNDGKRDIVMLTQQGSSLVPAVSWLRGNGDGTFADSSIVISSGFGCNDARSLQIQDLDGDSKPEMAILCYNPARLYVFRRHTDGVWKGGNTQIQPLTNPVAFQFGHLSPGDACATGLEYTGKPCIDVAVSQLSAGATVRILKNLTIGAASGTGAFNIAITGNVTTNLYGYGSDIDMADFDSDGYLDVVVSMYTQNSNASANAYGQIFYLLRGDNLGGFSTMEGFGMEAIGGAGVSVQDMDNNGSPDIFLGYRTARTPYRIITRAFNYSP